MQSPSSVLASGAVLALASMIVSAQTTPAGPFQQVTQAEFNQLVQSGQVTVVSAAAQAQQNQQAQLTEAQNQAVVDAFLKQNPNLTGLAALAHNVPSGPDIVPTTGGDYLLQITNNQGAIQTIQTLGQSALLADLAGSIQASTDPVQQLALYQSLYSQYAAVYSRLCPSAGSNSECADLTPPSALTNPSALQNASLGTIKEAIQALSSQGGKIVTHFPAPPPSGPLASCTANIGASLTATNVDYGDQTDSPSTPPSPSGIVANFSWLNANQLTCVKNQGLRGTCHIFASTSAMEELIARDTGDYVNLSEQDFMEHEKLVWERNLYVDGGSALTDLNNAFSHGYQFAYESQWDYNPSLSQTTGYVNTCENYPSTEPGCSDTAPQAPEVCYALAHGWACGFYTEATLSGPPSPYQSNGAVSIWDSDAGTLVGNILAALALDDAVIVSFQFTPNSAHPTDGYVAYSTSDTNKHLGGHVIHVVGFVSNTTLAGNPATAPHVTTAGNGYFIIKNSLGTTHGDAGYDYWPVDYLTAMATGATMVSTETH